MSGRELADVSEDGNVQCPFVTINGAFYEEGVLCCVLRTGHNGPHEDVYGRGQNREWFVEA